MIRIINFCIVKLKKNDKRKINLMKNNFNQPSVWNLNKIFMNIKKKMKTDFDTDEICYEISQIWTESQIWLCFMIADCIFRAYTDMCNKIAFIVAQQHGGVRKIWCLSSIYSISPARSRGNAAITLIFVFFIVHANIFTSVDLRLHPCAIFPLKISYNGDQIVGVELHRCLDYTSQNF